MAEVITTPTENNPKVLYYFFIQLVIAMCFGYSGYFQGQLRLIFDNPLYLMICLFASQVMTFALIWGVGRLKQNRSVSPFIPVKTEYQDKEFLDTPEVGTNKPHDWDSIPKPTMPSIDQASSDHATSFFDNGEINYAGRVKFKIDFERSHPDFFESQKNQYDYLTNNEMWLLAYLHLKLSTREIAVLLNIDPGSVRRAKTRLQRKLGLKVAK